MLSSHVSGLSVRPICVLCEKVVQQNFPFAQIFKYANTIDFNHQIVCEE
jgi:hypothetical protein